MSMTEVRTYFRARLNALNYREHPDGFNFENIPQTILDRSYHLEIGLITGSTANQETHNFSYPLTIRIFLKGFRDPAAKIDDAIGQAEVILADVLKPSNRLGVTIKDVVPDTVQVIPLDGTNDNDMILQMDFTTNLVCKFGN